jgi:hypothetical protein
VWAQSVWAQPGDSGVVTDGQNDLGDPESVSRGPRCPVHAGPSWVPRSSDHAARACRGGQRDGPDLVSLAVQADLSGSGGEDDVLDIETGRTLAPGPRRTGITATIVRSRALRRAAARSTLPCWAGVSFLSAAFLSAAFGPGFAVPEDGAPLRG